MSPSEFDLRAALRDGEGAELDVDRIVAVGRARRGRRRTQLLTAAAAVLVVAGIGTGAAALLGGGSQGGSGGSAGNDAAGGRAAAPDRGVSSTSDPASSDSATSHSARSTPRADRAAEADVPVACPASFPETLLPGGGSPGQFGSGDPLFARPVHVIVVCGYGSAKQTGLPARLVVTGTQATSLARSLDNASKRDVLPRCPPPEVTSRLTVTGVTSAGRVLRTITIVVTNPACNGLVTNGTAVRYGWQPPAGLGTELNALSPAGVPRPSVRPSGKNIGTPIHN